MAMRFRPVALKWLLPFGGCGPRRTAASRTRLRLSHSSAASRAVPQKQRVRGIARLVPIAIVELRQEGAERALLIGRHLHADQHPPDVRAVVAIVEQADVPALT